MKSSFKVAFHDNGIRNVFAEIKKQYVCGVMAKKEDLIQESIAEVLSDKDWSIESLQGRLGMIFIPHTRTEYYCLDGRPFLEMSPPKSDIFDGKITTSWNYRKLSGITVQDIIDKIGQRSNLSKVAMMKTSELTDAFLDYWVAKAEGINVKIAVRENTGDPIPRCITLTQNTGMHYSPSTQWSVGGPIIERERISLRQADDTIWGHVRAEWEGGEIITADSDGDGPTPLIAAMRAYVASKFGDEVPEVTP